MTSPPSIPCGPSEQSVLLGSKNLQNLSKRNKQRRLELKWFEPKWPCGQHHHLVHVDDGEHLSANGENNHHGQTFQTSVGGELSAPISHLVDEKEKDSYQQKKQLPRLNGTRLIVAVPCRIEFTATLIAGCTHLEETSSSRPDGATPPPNQLCPTKKEMSRTQLNDPGRRWSAHFFTLENIIPPVELNLPGHTLTHTQLLLVLSKCSKRAAALLPALPLVP